MELIAQPDNHMFATAVNRDSIVAQQTHPNAGRALHMYAHAQPPPHQYLERMLAAEAVVQRRQDMKFINVPVTTH